MCLIYYLTFMRLFKWLKIYLPVSTNICLINLNFSNYSIYEKLEDLIHAIIMILDFLVPQVLSITYAFLQF